MLKRKTNLLIKLFLTIILICIIAIIFAKATPVGETLEISEEFSEETNNAGQARTSVQETCLPANPQQSVEQENYYAINTWEYLMQRNYGKVITSAILGNMMVETAGGTLNLKPEIYSASKNYYGLCQWSLKYHPRIDEFSFEHQLDYLTGTMPLEFNTFGYLYKAGFGYDDFLKLTDIEEATLAFAVVYERCTPVTYKARQEAALKAYNYFNLN